MSSNPFESPTSSGDDSIPNDGRQKRPLLLGAMAAFNLLGGLGGATMIALMALLPEVRATIARTELNFVAIVVVAMLSNSLRIVLAFGIWKGALWGWRLAVFYYCLILATHLIRSLFAMIAFIPAAAAWIPGVAGNNQSASMSLMTGIFSLGLLGYLFMPRVVEYFRLENVHRAKELSFAALSSAAVSALLVLLLTRFA